FELSKYSARGMGPTEWSIQAHRIGLENNWHLDDLGALAAFNCIRSQAAIMAKYAVDVKLAKFVEKENPDKNRMDYIAALDKLYEKIGDTPLHSAEQRDTLLTQMRDIVALGAEKGYISEREAQGFSQTYNNIRKRDKLIRSGKEPAFSDQPLIAPLEREATDAEMKNAIGDEFHNRMIQLGAILKEEDPDIFNIGELGDEGDLKSDTFDKMRSVVKYAPVSVGQSNTLLIEIIRDEKGLEKYKQLGREKIDEWNAIIHESVPDDALGLKKEALAKACVTNQLQRSMDGFSANYLKNKTTLASGLEGLMADVTIAMDEKANERLMAASDKYPIHDCILEGDKQLTTYVDYLKEKEKGNMNPEREDEFRLQLYSQSASLLHKVRKLSETARFDRDEVKKLDKVMVMQSDPFQMSIYSPRGTLPYVAALEANIAGLENGWAIEDIPALEVFNQMRQSERMKCLCQRATEFNNFKEFDPPQYKSPEHEQYLNKLDEFFKTVKQTTLKTPEDRVRVLNNMQKLVVEGMDKGFITTKTLITPMMHQLRKARERDAAVFAGKERGVFKPIGQTAMHFEDMEAAKSFNTRRAFGRESDEHKILRETYEEFKQLRKSKGIAAEQTLEEQGALLDKIDMMEHYANVYQEKKAKAGSDVGKERLKGAKKIEDIAGAERAKLLDRINRNRPQKEGKISIGDFRKLLAKDRAEKALDSITEMGNLRGKGIDKEQLVSKMADYIVYQLSESKVPETAKAFKRNGAAVLKNEIMQNKEFKNMAATYMKGGKTGADLAQDLKNGNCMKKLGNAKNKIDDREKAKQRKIEEVKQRNKQRANS
ncbi:MAG: hypothetical protein J5842_01985, partial [Lachnospiraceae bacterium]|nr:hypothetical protein [Lachnospiraceae bacterium]